MLAILCAAPTASAQNEESGNSVAVEALRSAVLNPTTYVPAGLFYTSARLDWESSRPFFAHGALEENPGFTVSGRPHDLPVSYADGNRRAVEP